MKGRVGLVEVQKVEATGCHLVVTTPTRTFMLEAEDPELSASFASALNTRRDSMPTMKKRSEWAPNKEAPTCALCARRFTVTFRRHHCRFCGGVACGDCAPPRKTMALKKRKGVVRCCHECFSELCPENAELEHAREVTAARRRHATAPSRINPYRRDSDVADTERTDDASSTVESMFMLSNLWGTGITAVDLALAIAPYGRLIEVGGVDVTDLATPLAVDTDDTCLVQVIERHPGAFSTDQCLTVRSHAIRVERCAEPPPDPPKDSPVANRKGSVLGPSQQDAVACSLRLVGVMPLATFGEVRLALAPLGRVDALNGVGVNHNGLWLGPNGDDGAVGDVPRCGYHEVSVIPRKDAVIPDATNVNICGAAVRVTKVTSDSQHEMSSPKSVRSGSVSGDAGSAASVAGVYELGDEDVNPFGDARSATHSEADQSRTNSHSSVPQSPAKSLSGSRSADLAVDGESHSDGDGPAGNLDGLIARCSDDRPSVSDDSTAPSPTGPLQTPIRGAEPAESPRVRAATEAKAQPAPRSRAAERTQSALAWCREMAEGTGIQINNFSRDFGSGLAFCAIMHGVFPDKIDMTTLTADNRAENFETAFRVAEEGGQERFLDVEDCVALPYPDKLAVMTYIFELQRRFKKR